ncbi:MAG TPA: GTPase HflX [Armatimonadota bacterium]|jgi:GTP-binding protein HflX
MQEVGTREKALLVFLQSGDEANDRSLLDELRELASTAGAEVVGEFSQKRQKPDPTHFLGQGKVEELFVEVTALEADLVIVNAELSPNQLKHLDDELPVRVIDRTQLILDIFAQRAQTREGKLQVELAQLNYLLPRLSGLGKALSRLGGGIGTRGPGETKLETDRRRIREQISALKDELDEVRQHRQIQRQSRERLPFPSAALVGYTSAGKSTLLNTLSGSDVLVDRMLFATLDPTTRRVVLPDGWGVLLTDTVGFIRDLPHHLVAAFRSTLEEVTSADFLIHVVDASHPDMNEQIKAVHEVLEELGASDKPMLTVFNKCDLVADQYELRRLVACTLPSVYISARTHEGIDYLMAAITRILQELFVHMSLDVPYERSDLLSFCYDNGRVISAEYTPNSILIEADISSEFAGRLRKYERSPE